MILLCGHPTRGGFDDADSQQNMGAEALPSPRRRFLLLHLRNTFETAASYPVGTTATRAMASAAKPVALSTACAGKVQRCIFA